MRMLFAAMHESVVGPNRRFAAMQRDACYGKRSGRSADAASTAAPDPNRSFGGYLGRDP
jgi:hypothetical protein